MGKDSVLAHAGLALVTYVPLTLYVASILIRKPDAAPEIFGSGMPEFLGFFATAMTMFGSPLVLVSLVISLRGLVRRDHRRTNGVTLACCVAWIAAAYWVVTHFR